MSPITATTTTTTIAAIATASAPAGIGVIRVSGPLVLTIAVALIGRPPQARRAHYVQFRDAAGATIDTGVLLYFQAPHSYTGEHVLELQGHGSPMLQRMLLRRLFELGACQARPGEFSERAYLNGKLDLAQAEAVADLISSQTEEAARAAVRSLDGEFSRRVQKLLHGLIELRLHIESAIDFPEEEIDFLADGALLQRLTRLRSELSGLHQAARRGQRLRDGWYVVIVGPPNAGKSSLLNRLAGSETAIVTDIAGTTRDVLREQIVLEGLAITLVDTAGLRDTADLIEAEGIRRAHAELVRADLALLLSDWRSPVAELEQLAAELPPGTRWLAVRSKIDQADEQQRMALRQREPDSVQLSVRETDGMLELQQALLGSAGHTSGAGSFSARERHLRALEAVELSLEAAEAQLAHKQGELAAADLHEAQRQLSLITGEFTPDDLLGEIFSRFCIGK